MKLKHTLLLFISGFLISACADSSENKVGKDHVWKEQVETIDRAEGVEDLLKKSADAQKKAIEDQM
jgi:hypothetical protein